MRSTIERIVLQQPIHNPVNHLCILNIYDFTSKQAEFLDLYLSFLNPYSFL